MFRQAMPSKIVLGMCSEVAVFHWAKLLRRLAAIPTLMRG